MAEFINTVEVVGDEALIDSIIDRSITEYKDNSCLSVGEYAFYGCKLLETVDLPNVISIGSGYVNESGAFRGCSALKTINIPNVTSIGNGTFTECGIEKLYLPAVTGQTRSIAERASNLWLADFGSTVMFDTRNFYNSSKFSALILRSETIVRLLNTNTFSGTKIDLGTGYIYVPRALVDSYKAATNWSTYADQFRALEDYTVDGTTTGELDETKI